METFTKGQIDREFAELIERSKDIGPSNDMLRDFICDFKLRTNYRTTPYKLQVPRLYRARPVEVANLEAAEEKFSCLERLSYPSASVVHKVPLGRCNWAGEAVFYCSNETGVPFFEVRPEVGNYVMLAHYKHKSKKEIEVYAPVIGVKKLVEKLTARGQTDNIVEIIKHDPKLKPGKEILAYIDDFFSGWFVQDVNKDNNYYYRLTTALFSIFCHMYIVEEHNMDGLLYPSTTSELTGLNLALKTDFVDKNLTFEKAIIYQLEEKQGKEIHLRALKEAFEKDVDSEGNLKWIETKGMGRIYKLSPDTETVTLDRKAF